MPYLHQFYFTLHQVKTMFEYACEKCEKSFVSGSKLKQHNNQLHEEVKCDECGKMFKKETLLGIARFTQTVTVCSHVKYVQRLSAERTICMHMLPNAIESHPNYNHVDKSTEEYGQAILSCVAHFNSNNL